MQNPSAEDTAVGNISRERGELVKKARALRKLLEQGRITPADLERTRSQFKGVHKHVLDEVLQEERKPRKKQS